MQLKYNKSFSKGYYKVSFKAYGDRWFWEGEAETREEAYKEAIKQADNIWFDINEPPKPWEVTNLRIKHVAAPSYDTIEEWQFIAGISWIITLAMIISQFL